MGRIRHRYQRFVFKFILSVIGISLFAGQLSYKFYLHASLPVFHAAFAKENTGQSENAGHPILPNYHNRQLLTLDKRYDAKHIFELFTPPSQIVTLPPVRQTAKFIQLAGAVVSNTAIIITLRGPPTCISA
ncbi:MAG: hypothetical protein P4L51_29705 [Puia sp.]|nr:hypothetical protein [Puia sp.]